MLGRGLATGEAGGLREGKRRDLPPLDGLTGGGSMLKKMRYKRGVDEAR